MPLLENIPQIRIKLQTLHDVGLGYVHLGQSSTTLSGGEAQRIKLAKELSKRQTGRTFYLLDEPTTGLHFDDVRKLLDVLQRLVDLGNTVVVIEHNLDVIKTADWIIDLGPDGGEYGGRIVVVRHARAGGPPQKKLHRGSPPQGAQMSRHWRWQAKACPTIAGRQVAVVGHALACPVHHFFLTFRGAPMSRYSQQPLDFANLKTVSLEERGGKVKVADFAAAVRARVRHCGPPEFAAAPARRR